MSFHYRFAPHITKIPSNPIIHLSHRLNEPGFINFAPGAPAAETFPYQDISKITEELLSRNLGEIMQYGTTEGYPPARNAMAKLISRAGLKPKPENIVITTGGQQALNMLFKMFVEPGDVVLVESPTYSAALQILKSHRAHAIPLDSDGDGLLPEDLEEKIGIFDPKAVYLNPTFKNPSGGVISLERRKAAAEITGRLGVLLIEDDPCRDLRYAGDHLPAIKSFDRSGNVVYITSTSKILCPGLRVGAAYVPDALVPTMIVTKQAADMHSPTLPQAIVSLFAERGLLEPHIGRICGIYGKKLDLAMSAIGEFFPEEVGAATPQGGLFIWCVCPENVNVAEVFERAIRQKVAFLPGDQFFPDGGGQNAFRLNFTNAKSEDIAKGVEILGRLLRDCVRA